MGPKEKRYAPQISRKATAESRPSCVSGHAAALPQRDGRDRTTGNSSTAENLERSARASPIPRKTARRKVPSSSQSVYANSAVHDAGADRHIHGGHAGVRQHRREYW